MADYLEAFIEKRGRKYRYKDLSNIRFGRLIALKRIKTDKNRHAMWECICDCGNIKLIAGTSLLEGHTMSCGCYQKEVIGKSGITHGKSNSKIYRVWRGMISRCYGNDIKYEKRYKGRIFVCDRWKESFQNFYDDMSPSYKEGLSLDRVDNNGNYCPENCRWTTAEVQANNKSNNILYAIGDDSYSISQLERISGTNRSTIKTRLSRGWDISRAVYGEPVTDIKQISEYLVF